MIREDQPPVFEGVIAAVSSKEDGQMQHGWSEPVDEVTANRCRFLESVGVTLDATALVRVSYGAERTYDIITEVDESQAGVGMKSLGGDIADCLVTTKPGVGLFLPVADCIATIVFDPKQKVLALAHLGRHSTVAHLTEKLITYLHGTYQSQPEDLLVWMSPSIQGASYHLAYADFVKSDPDWAGCYTTSSKGISIDMQKFNRQLLEKAGVKKNHITISSVDTATSDAYWSHQIEVSSLGQAPPRFAVVCALK